MKWVLLALALGLVSVAGGSSVAVTTPVPGTAALLAPQGPRRPARAHDPDEPTVSSRCAGDLEDGQESLDQGLPRAGGAQEQRRVRQVSLRRPPAPACPNLLFSAPKTGPPPLLAGER